MTNKKKDFRNSKKGLTKEMIKSAKRDLPKAAEAIKKALKNDELLASPGKTISVSPSSKWECTCGREHSIDPYAAAHWSVELVHTCDCGMKRVLHNGRLQTPENQESEV